MTVKLESSASATSEQTLPELLITSRSIVYPWQCDHMGYMNVMWYTGKFDEATWQLVAPHRTYSVLFTQ
jgi:hypothetical protein